MFFHHKGTQSTSQRLTKKKNHSSDKQKQIQNVKPSVTVICLLILHDNYKFGASGEITN